MLCPSTIVASVTAFAIALSEGKSSDELDLLGAVFTQLGDTITTISTQQSAIEAKCNKEKEAKCDKEDRCDKI